MPVQDIVLALPGLGKSFVKERRPDMVHDLDEMVFVVFDRDWDQFQEMYTDNEVFNHVVNSKSILLANYDVTNAFPDATVHVLSSDPELYIRRIQRDGRTDLIDHFGIETLMSWAKDQTEKLQHVGRGKILSGSEHVSDYMIESGLLSWV